MARPVDSNSRGPGKRDVDRWRAEALFARPFRERRAEALQLLPQFRSRNDSARHEGALAWAEGDLQGLTMGDGECHQLGVSRVRASRPCRPPGADPDTDTVRA